MDDSTHNSLIVLPFRDIPIVKKKLPPAFPALCVQVQEWAEGDLLRYSFAFMCSTVEPQGEEDYSFPLGFIESNSLVTTAEVIVSISQEMINYDASQVSLRSHISQYFEKLKMIPTWGEPEFYRLTETGRTPRLLKGPNIGGSLKKGESRQVIPISNGSLVYGPLFPNFALDK